MKEEVTLSRVKITETSLRDGHQSLMATRLTTAEILPIVEKMDRAGYYALEVWGGATFDSAIRFLNEDPWERLREIRKRAKNTKLQMLLRGQNLLGSQQLKCHRIFGACQSRFVPQRSLYRYPERRYPYLA